MERWSSSISSWTVCIFYDTKQANIDNIELAIHHTEIIKFYNKNITAEILRL